MLITEGFLIVCLVALSLLLAVGIIIFAYRRSASGFGINQDQIAELLRAEVEKVKSFNDENARNLRTEVVENSLRFQDSMMKAFQGLGETLNTTVKDFGVRLDNGIKAIDERVAGVGTKLDQSIVGMAEEAAKSRETLRNSIEIKLNQSAESLATASQESRKEMADIFQRFKSDVASTLTQANAAQKEHLENIAKALGEMSGKQVLALEDVKKAVEGRLDILRNENTAKLEEMRKTVDEKLQTTLEKRLGESFKLVSDQLEQVHKGVGEMQVLAGGVGDLKRVLTNVKSRGTWAEVSLGNLLEQIMAAEQYGTNIEVRPGSSQRVEYAIKLPNGEESSLVPLWLPIDAKFPIEDYERLMDASERAHVEDIESATRALEGRIRNAAKDISEKYVHPPHSTDFAVMFLPTEGLFAEAIRRPGLVDSLQRDFRVVIAGPTTLMALLNSLRMGFRTLAIQKQSSEVWKVLAEVKGEFGKYGEVMKRIHKKLEEAQKVVDEVGTRHRVIDRKLRGVEAAPEAGGSPLIALVRSEEEAEVDEPEAATG